MDHRLEALTAVCNVARQIALHGFSAPLQTQLRSALQALDAGAPVAVSTLDCKTPQCPQARTVVLTGPTPVERYGKPGQETEWWCGSCGSVWRHWELLGAGEPVEQEDEAPPFSDQTLGRPMTHVQMAAAYERIQRALSEPEPATDPLGILPSCARCWRTADLPGGLCFHCSVEVRMNAAPAPSTLRRRDAVFGGED